MAAEEQRHGADQTAVEVGRRILAWRDPHHPKVFSAAVAAVADQTRTPVAHAAVAVEADPHGHISQHLPAAVVLETAVPEALEGETVHVEVISAEGMACYVLEEVMAAYDGSPLEFVLMVVGRAVGLSLSLSYHRYFEGSKMALVQLEARLVAVVEADVPYYRWVLRGLESSPRPCSALYMP